MPCICVLTTTERWLPMMNHFAKDHNGFWWFTTVGKGNKERQIAVSDSMLAALKRYRAHLQLSPLPSLNDNMPLLTKLASKQPITSSTYIREIVQVCFDRAITRLQEAKLIEDADELMNATVHWLRHTGISDDVKHRPREHVRDDAGHSSGAITDKYIDVEMRERYKSAQNKSIKPDQD
jgi:integrase